MNWQKTMASAFAVAAACCGAVALGACKKQHVHAWSEWETVTPATCTKAGARKRTCACGEEERQTLAATGHRFGDWTQTEEEHVHVCLNGCGEEKERARHAFGTDNACTACGYALAYTASLTYAEVTDGEDKLVGYAVSGCRENPAEVVVPAYHEGLPVTQIGQSAFYREAGDSALKRVSLPDTVTQIGNFAFYGTPIEGIDFKRVESIGNYAFYETALKSVVLPESVETLGKQVFQGCAQLREITFCCAPEIGDYLFWKCEKLNRVVIENNGTAFKKNTFYEFASASVDVVVGDSVTSVAPRLAGGSLIDEAAYVKSVTLGKNVTEIGESAFQSCTGITGLVIPEGVKTIGALAFDGCASLAEVSLPKSVKTVGAGAFAAPSAMEKVNYAGTASDWAKLSFGNRLANPLYNGAALWLDGREASEIVIDGAEEVSSYAFMGAAITKITFGESVKRVGQQAFDRSAGAAKIQSVVILNKTFSVGARAFNNALSADTEVYYKGTAAEMNENVLYGASNVHYFKGCKHYFYAETPEAEPAETDGTWTFGGYWKFASDGKTIEKTEISA